MSINVEQPIPLVSGILARFVQECAWSTIPDAVRHEAKRSLLNFFGVALAASRDPTIEKAVSVFERFSGGPQSQLIGRNKRIGMLEAASLNAMSANVFDFDDTHIPTVLHPTAPVAPAVLALAEHCRASGISCLTAFILGVEIECRVANAVSPSHYARGWHITSTCGVFGSAMATSRLLGLNAKQMSWALGSASSQAAGLVETLGTMAKSVGVGNAARNGLLSTFLAQENFDGPSQPLEGERGFLTVFGEAPDLAAVVGDLGKRWEITRNTYKPYPCGVVLNPVIDACMELAARPDLKATDWSDVTRIELIGHPLLRQRTNRPAPETGRKSQVSAQHAVAVTLLRARAGLEEFSDHAVADPAVLALGSKVVFSDNADLPIETVHLRIERQSHDDLQVTITASLGSLEKPLSDADLENKLRDLCRYGKSGCDSEKLIDSIWNLERADDVSSLVSCMRGT
jgi:2-methylcitrate dehydratase PrpD